MRDRKVNVRFFKLSFNIFISKKKKKIWISNFEALPLFKMMIGQIKFRCNNLQRHSCFFKVKKFNDYNNLFLDNLFFQFSNYWMIIIRFMLWTKAFGPRFPQDSLQAKHGTHQTRPEISQFTHHWQAEPNDRHKGVGFLVINFTVHMWKLKKYQFAQSISECKNYENKKRLKSFASN